MAQQNTQAAGSGSTPNTLAEQAMVRLTNWINRAAGQHRRAIAASFAEARAKQQGGAA